MLTRIRMKSQVTGYIAIWLIAMATLFVAPSACAASACASAEAAPACHAPAPPASDHCGSGAPCCPPADAGDPASSGPHACLSSAPQSTDTALLTVETPTLELAAAFLPAPAPWIYLATDTHPHSTAPLLPPRDLAARPQGSRAPPASLA